MFLEGDLLRDIAPLTFHHRRDSPSGLDKRYGGISGLDNVNASVSLDYIRVRASYFFGSYKTSALSHRYEILLIAIGSLSPLCR